MRAKELTCRVVDVLWLTPTVFRLRFEPLKRFSFEPGQFVSVIVPSPIRSGAPVKRCYSLAGTPEEALTEGYYELCIKYVEDGRGSGYLAGLSRGDLFRAVAPFGHFTFKSAQNSPRQVCFVATGSGLAPFRSMALSQNFRNKVSSATVLFGARTEDEIFYKKDFTSANVRFIAAVSQKPETPGLFHGRVTDYLKQLPRDFPFHSTDFYLCGNGEMVADVNQILRGSYGVAETAIHKEAFSLTVARKPAPASESEIAPQKKMAFSDYLTTPKIWSRKQAG